MCDKQLLEITPIEVDFAQWYTDVVKKAKLIEYSGVRGCVIVQPYGYAIWENIQKELDMRFKITGHENVCMPMFIPESLLNREKDHVAGFSPEVAWVTHGGSEPLAERLCVRPTSETLFCEYYSKIVHSYRDLPKLYNQWCTVVRWEKTTRPFLRSVEFLWQEGHTAHISSQEAHIETMKMLDLYEIFCSQILAIPVIKGEKTEKEKFAGAKNTYTIESLMIDGKVLQTATSHDFGDGFARAFNIQYADEHNNLQFVHQTSWGMSTRVIGAIIMVHGDNKGLKLPPKIAPIQVIIIPIGIHKNNVNEMASEIFNRLSGVFRVELDRSDKSPGWKFSEYEMRGVPLRLEIGPRDLKSGTCVLVRRDTGEKTCVSVEDIEHCVEVLLDEIQNLMLNSATNRLRENVFYAKTFEQLSICAQKGGFIQAMWCGNGDCEDKIKEQLALSSRCIALDEKTSSGYCVCCGNKADKLVFWGKAY